MARSAFDCNVPPDQPYRKQWGEQKIWEQCPFPPGSFVEALKARSDGFAKPTSHRPGEFEGHRGRRNVPGFTTTLLLPAPLPIDLDGMKVLQEESNNQNQRRTK